MPDHDFESTLAGQLRAYAEGGVRPIDRYAIAEATIAAPRSIGQRWSLGLGQRRLVPVLAGLLLLLAMAAMALLAGSYLLKPNPVLRSGYDAIFLRAISDAPGADLDVIAVRPDGRERLVRHLTASMLPDGRTFLTGGSTSQDGWLAVGTSTVPGSDVNAVFAWALVDFADPARPPRLAPSILGGAFGSHGRFASVASGAWTIQVVDADSGATTSLADLSLPGGGPDIIWTADGSGLLVARGGDGDHVSYATKPIDGRPETPTVPALAFSRGSRYVAAGGASLVFCGSATSCTEPPRPGGTVWVWRGVDSATGWYSGELAPARLLDASFSADGQAIWLLLDRAEGSRHTAVIARADAPGAVRVIATVDLGEDLYHAWFNAFAPDDSTIAIGHWTGSESDMTIEAPILVSTSDLTTGAHRGNLVGFVPAPLTDAWPGGDAAPAVPGAGPPSSAP